MGENENESEYTHYSGRNSFDGTSGLSLSLATKKQHMDVYL